MTRDEAIERAAGAFEFGNPARSFVDMAEALGLLKLDEPKTPEDELLDAVPESGYIWGASLPGISVRARPQGYPRMMVYHVYIERDGAEKWIALAMYSTEQATLLGHAFPDITRIETWAGDSVYKAKRKRTVH